MKNFLSKYIFEVLILLIGLALGLAQSFFVQDVNLAILISSISMLLSISTLAIRKELTEQISEQFELLRIVRSISNEYWRAEAEEELDQFKFKIELWAQGNRLIPLSQSIPFQIKLLRRSMKKVYAIHVGLYGDALYKWSKESGSFSKLIEAHKKLGSNLEKKRIFVCDDQLLHPDKDLIRDDRIKEIFKRQMASIDEGGFGVDLRVLWKSTIYRTKSQIPVDILIVDDSEVVVVRGAGEIYLEMEAIINTTQVKSYLKLFELYWEISDPARRYLDV